MKVLVIGASLKSERYSNKAIKMLTEYNHDVFAVGLRVGIVNGIEVKKQIEKIEKIDTITLYLNPNRQTDYFDDIIVLRPNRVIFNPGTENPALFNILNKAKINYEVACTLVLLRSNLF